MKILLAVPASLAAGWPMAFFVAACLFAGCERNSSGRPPTPAASRPALVDVAATTGLDFAHVTGARGKYHVPESVGSGGALLDYDGDGDLDVYLVQSGDTGPEYDAAQPVSPAPGGRQEGNRLFRNELIPAGTLTFVDVTEYAGVGDLGYGMGVTVGDYDNDGDPDIYVTNFGPNTLYRNDGNGRFSDVTDESGTDDARWSTSAAFVDIENDGDLDLFVATYLDYSIEADVVCKDPAGRRDYCGPNSYPPTTDRLFRNEGDGRFTDISDISGIASAAGPGLGVLGADLDGDGHVDIVVANDQHANFLWRNLGAGRFEERGLMSGVGYNEQGAVEASMGVTAGDFDSDGDDDLFMTHLFSQTNTLYVNNGHGVFTDSTAAAGLASASLRQTGFGSRWFDYDNDGDLDLYIANGSVAILEERVHISEYPYEQPDQLYENLGQGRFAEVSADVGLNSVALSVGRGAAFGDVDNDGDIDVLVINNRGAVQLLRNDLAERRPALRVLLEGRRSNRDGQGARAGLVYANGTIAWRRVHADGSYMSASDRRVHFGLKPGIPIDGIVVSWPAGRREWWGEVVGSGAVILVEGTGQPWPGR